MEPTLEDAISIAADAHRGQVYPATEPEPYILHPLRVMLDVQSGEARIVAVLQDVVEDSDVRLDDLATRGFDRVVIDALDSITRRIEETYDDYIRRLSSYEIARTVKLADIRDDLANNRRLPQDAARVARITRYVAAQRVLMASDLAQKRNETSRSPVAQGWPEASAGPAAFANVARRRRVLTAASSRRRSSRGVRRRRVATSAAHP